MKMIRVSVIMISYVIGLTVFTLYWGDNFVDYVHYKGDESTLFLEVLVVCNYSMLGLAMVFYRKINMLFLLFNPLLNVAFAFVLGLFFIILNDSSGTPKHTFYVFTPLFILSSLLSLVMYYYRNRTRIENY